MSKHYLGESGTSLILDTGILVGSANFKYINYRKPDGLTGTWSASFYSSYSQIAGAVGTYFLNHTLVATDLDTPGKWRFQSSIGAIDGTWLGETVEILIYDDFE